MLDNSGKKTAGIDGIKSITPKQRLILAQNLNLKSKPLPARRILIPKPNGEQRPPYSETPIIRHIKVKGEKSPYDGELGYWAGRLGKHPELSARVSKILKKQKNKCNHCGLIFRDGDVWEVDHIIPKSLGGKNWDNNLQLLHRHCHDTKTGLDGSLNLGRTHNKG